MHCITLPGTCILSAARLTGKGKANIAGFLTLDPPPLPGSAAGALPPLTHFTAVDHTLNVSCSNASGSSLLVASHLRRLAALAHAPTSVPLSELALLYAGQLATTAGGGGAATDAAEAVALVAEV